jgi:molybdate transport system substrate-binding protein
MRLRAAILVALAMVLAGCLPSPGPSATDQHTTATASASAGASTAAASPGSGAKLELTVFGAASLKGVLEKLKTAYASSHPGVTTTMSTDSSAALETQIEQGAPADIFLSADTTNPQKLVDKGLASGNLVPFATNLLTVIVPTGNPGKILSPADLARPGVKVIAAGDSVPITKYATQLVMNLAKQPGYPADYVGGYTANIASKEDNVGAVVAKVGLGEGDAAIVYQTDAKTSPKVAAIPVPAGANVAATYAGVVVKARPNQAAAEAFLGWLAGPEGQSILTAAGFRPAD